MKKKILIVSGIYPLFKGGAEYQMRLIADNLNEEYEIVFLYLGDVPGNQVSSTECRVVDGYKVYFIKSSSKLDTLFLKRNYARRIKKVLEIERPDFVYQRVLKFISFYISKYQISLNYKHLIHIADLFTLKFDRSSIRGKINFYFFTKTLSNHPEFVVQTSEQAKILKSYNIQPSLQVYNMHPILNIDISKILEEKSQQGIKHIVWVANIKPIKQLEIFVEIARQFINDSRFHFTVIGSIQDPAYAKAIIEVMNKCNNISHYVGKDNIFVNDFLLEKASLVLNTSVSEGFSNVFIQSWLRGVPVISLNSNPDGIFGKYPEFGCCIEGDVKLLREKLLEFLEDELYTKKAFKCFIKSSELFSFDNISKIKNLLK